MGNIISDIRKILTDNMDEAVRESGLRFFREEVKIYGLKSAFVNKLAAQEYKKIKHLPKNEIFNLCEELWKSGYLEESFVACNWSYKQQKDFSVDDFETFSRWIEKYITNWASCDTFCNHTMGSFLDMYPQFVHQLKEWTKSSNRWVRRASAVSLIIPAKEGRFTKDVFEIASQLLTDSDEMVQKGYGWLLKVTSQAGKEQQRMVFDYVVSHKDVMPRTALRYAIEKMPQELRKEAMKK